MLAFKIQALDLINISLIYKELELAKCALTAKDVPTLKDLGGWPAFFGDLISVANRAIVFFLPLIFLLFSEQLLGNLD